MTATNHWLDLLGAHETHAGRRGADYALAKILGCGSSVVYHYRSGKRHLSENHCLIVAQRLGIDPLQVFASVNAERAPGGPLHDFWSGLARKGGRAALLALGVMVAANSYSPRAEAAPRAAPGVNIVSDCLYNARTSRRKPGKGKPH